jgi:hypothetical protein
MLFTLRDMTGKKSAGVFAHHDLAIHHHRSSHQKNRITTAPFYPRYQPALFPDRACPLLGSGIDSLRHHGGGGDLANRECSRIHKALPVVNCTSAEMMGCSHDSASWTRSDRHATDQGMLRRVTVGLVVVAALFSATVRLPAAPCIVTNTPGPKACQPGCCANKACCATSHERTGPPVQPLAKSGLDQQNFAALPVTTAPLLTLSISNESKIVSQAEPTAHSPPRLSMLCTFLI